MKPDLKIRNYSRNPSSQQRSNVRPNRLKLEAVSEQKKKNKEGERWGALEE